MISLNWLRKNCQNIHFFGLGFVQLKVDENLRYHFYHPNFSSFVENPHDHRYSFTSHVIKGALENTIWETYNESGSNSNLDMVYLRYDNCTADKKDEQMPAKQKVFVRKVATFTTKAGSGYFMDKDIFHQVSPVGNEPCITRIIRNEKVKQYARILETSNNEDICPFSLTLDDDVLWSIVSECLEWK